MTNIIMETINHDQQVTANSSASSGSEHNHASTTFSNDDREKVVSYSSNSITDNLVIHDQSIIDFMKKPRLVYTGTWATTDTAGSLLTNNSILGVLNTVTYWTNKLQGFRYYRATACIRVVVNASPFHQGKLVLSFLPAYNIAAGTSSAQAAMYQNMRIKSRSGLTQLPHAEIDCRDTSVLMEIPYVSPYNYCYIASNVADPSDWGQYYLSVLSPLKTGPSGETSVNFCLYLHFEDSEMACPTIPQGPSTKKKFAVKRMSDLSKEESMEGDVTRVLNVGTKVASSLAMVPSLAPIMGPSSWVLRGLSGISSFFGWSKPNSSSSIQLMTTNNRFFYGANSDGFNPYPCIGMLNEGKIDISDCMSLTDKDEMSMQYLKSIRSFYKQVTWSGSSAAGTSLLSQQVKPKEFYTTGTSIFGGKTASWKQGGPLFYMSYGFYNYRGGFEVTLKFVKTLFHSGRIQITFTPYGSNGTPSSPDIYTSQLALRHIVDIRELDEITIVLPFLINVNYLRIDDSIGQLDVVVLNELKCPETANSDIDILFYSNGHVDFEFARPTSEAYQQPFGPQMGLEQVIAKQDVIGGEIVGAPTLEFASSSMGESITSIKQLLLRLGYPAASPGWGSSSAGQLMAISPYPIGVVFQDSATGSSTSGVFGGDAFSIFSSMYAFSRGSVNIGINTTATIVAANLASLGTHYLTASSDSTGYTSMGAYAWHQVANYARVGCRAVMPINAENQVSMVRVPMYYHRKAWTNIPNTSNVVATSGNAAPINMVGFLPTAGLTGNTWNIARSVADDFQLSYFIGCPPILSSDPA